MKMQTRTVKGLGQPGGPKAPDNLLMGTHEPQNITKCATGNHKTLLDPSQPLGHAGAMQIGDRIKRTRKRAGRTQQWLREQLNVAQTTVSSWETNRTTPSRRQVAKIARLLGVPLSELDPQDDVPARTSNAGFPLVGRIMNGGEAEYPEDRDQRPASIYVQPLAGMLAHEDIIVLSIDDNTSVPALFEGDLAFFGPQSANVPQHVNKRVIVRLKNGKRYFKILKLGSTPGTFSLQSLNPALRDMEDVVVDWVLPFRGAVPAQY